MRFGEAHPVFRGDIRILAAGSLSGRVLDGLKDVFDVVAIPRASREFVTPEMADSVRGVAVIHGAGEEFISALPRLEMIASFGVGYDAVDIACALRRKVVVTNTPDVLNDEVADTAIALLLSTLRELPRAEAFLREGRWGRGERYPLTPGTLRGRRIGIFGLGRIGRTIARRLDGFDVPIEYHSRRQVEGISYRWHPSLVSLAHSVDTLICIVPGGRDTEHAVNSQILAALGPNGVLVNVGRGSTVDEPALIDALRNRTILAAGLDVYEKEPQVPQELISLTNAVLLPHVGSASVYTRNLMADLVVSNLTSWFSEGVAVTPVPECVDLAKRIV